MMILSEKLIQSTENVTLFKLHNFRIFKVHYSLVLCTQYCTAELSSEYYVCINKNELRFDQKICTFLWFQFPGNKKSLDI